MSGTIIGIDGKPQKSNDSYANAMREQVSLFKADVKKFAEEEKVPEEEAMIYVMQKNLFNLNATFNRLLITLTSKGIFK